MKYRNFGRDEISVSEVGLGAWQLGSADWGDVSDENTEQILEKCLESGITFYDTADVYGAGRCETFIGKFLAKHKDKRDKLYIASKVGRSPKLYPNKYTRESVTASVEGSLKRLGIEALDLMQTHCVPPEVIKDGEIFEWLSMLIKDGKIKSFGASVESNEEALLCMKHPDLCSLQIIFNIMRQKPLWEVFPTALEKKVAIIARLPLNSGMLSGKYTKDTQFGKKDHRTYNRDGKFFNVGETFGGIEFEKGIELVDDLKDILPANVPMAQLALRWILDQPGVTVVIPGASKLSQVVSNADASELPALDEDTQEELSKFYKEQVHSHIRGVY